MSFVILYALSIVSPVLAIGEPVCIALCLAKPSLWWLIALIITLGQMTGFAVLFFTGDRLLKYLPKLDKKLRSIDFERYQKSRTVATFSAGLFGLPPATAMSAAGPVVFHHPLPYFIFLFLGRSIRFWVVAGLPSLFVDRFDLNLTPAWLTDFF